MRGGKRISEKNTVKWTGRRKKGGSKVKRKAYILIVGVKSLFYRRGNFTPINKKAQYKITTTKNGWDHSAKSTPDSF